LSEDRLVLRTQGLRSGHGAVEVLHGIDLEVRAAEVVAVLGPNGAGKTTLMRTIVGLNRARAGSIRFGGEAIENRPPEDILAKGIALVPEGRRIFAALSVLENLRMGAYTVRDKATLQERLERTFELFPILAERRSQLAGTLSGGQQQQLAIARALLSDPSLVLLDEPSLGLAPVLVEMVFDLIDDMRARGLTVLLVEQNVHQALQTANRVYVLTSGAIESQGTAKEFRQQHLEAAYLGRA
jgi:branched-chain amino acid transport system ATP-binding protein